MGCLSAARPGHELLKLAARQARQHPFGVDRNPVKIDRISVKIFSRSGRPRPRPPKLNGHEFPEVAVEEGLGKRGQAGTVPERLGQA